MKEIDVKEVIKNVLNAIPISYEDISLEGDSMYWVNINSKESSLLIGRGGEVINSLNYLIKKILENKTGEKVSITIDVNGYKLKEKERIIEKAKIFGERVKNFKVNIKLEPMSAYERLIIHDFFSNDPFIYTESSGKGRDRYITLKYQEENSLI